VLTKDDIQTLAEIVIADPMRMNLLPQFCVTIRFVVFDVAQAKERSYQNQHPIDQFLPLAIEIFNCLHKYANMFLHDCANAM
jgi:hypothetical protein